VEETRIVLVRHGESRSQESRTVGGHTGCKGLSDRGRTQVEALRDRLARTGELSGAAALYSSVMARAVETAEILAPALDGLEVASECAFCESHPGPEADGLEVDEYERRWPPTGEWSPTTRRDPGGETYAEMRERVSGRLDELVERHRGETVVVACHGGVVLHSLYRWLDIGVPDRREVAWFNPLNASMTEWRFGDNPYRGTLPVQLVRYNDAAHLAGVEPGPRAARQRDDDPRAAEAAKKRVAGGDR
jgi:probable phosphoglycerate mutase